MYINKKCVNVSHVQSQNVYKSDIYQSTHRWPPYCASFMPFLTLLIDAVSVRQVKQALPDVALCFHQQINSAWLIN